MRELGRDVKLFHTDLMLMLTMKQLQAVVLKNKSLQENDLSFL